MANSEQAKFLEGNLFRHVAAMSLTASIGLIAIFLVDFADMIFISMIGEAELAAAVGYSGAILFFTTSFGIGMAITAGALVAQALGSGDAELARRRATTTVVIGFALAVILAIIVWLNLGFLTQVVGATGRSQELAVGYLQIIVPTMPILLLAIVGSAILRSHGDARRSMTSSIWGGVANAVLDPILIFGFELDLTGAAIASVVSRFVFAYFALRPIFQSYGGFVRPSFAIFRLDLKPVLAIAFPAILTQFATPIGSAYMTRVMAEFGELAVAGMAMVGRLTPVSFAVVFALSGAIGPIIGQNAGAGQMARVRTAFRDGLIFTGVYVLAAAAILFVLREPLADLFNAQGVARDLVYLFCGPLALVYFFNGVMFVANAAFNNLGHPFYSTWLNWGRHTLGTIPLVIYGANTWGAQGVLIGQAIGGVIFGLIALAFSFYVLNKQAVAPQGLNEPFAHRTRLSQFFHHRR
ncbi:MAG: putative MATE family efflux protein [Paracoccaceae bacterium]